MANFIDAQNGHRLHRALNSTLRAWRVNVEAAEWRNAADVKTTYAHASIVGADGVRSTRNADAGTSMMLEPFSVA